MFYISAYISIAYGIFRLKFNYTTLYIIKYMEIAKIVTSLETAPIVKTPVHRILVIDDNEACAITMMWTMEGLGHISQMAFDGKTAIEKAKIFKPNVVLLDIGIPNMNGYEICQTMRKDPELSNTVFIAQTGWAQKEHRARSKEAGFDHHLVKPIDITALKKILSELDGPEFNETIQPLETVL